MSRRCIRSNGLYHKPIACPTALALACRSFGLCQWAHSSKSCSQRRCNRSGWGEFETVRLSTACARHFSKESMQRQKPQQRRQEPRLQIVGFSYLRGRGASLKKMRHAFKKCVIEGSRKNQRSGDRSFGFSVRTRETLNYIGPAGFEPTTSLTPFKRSPKLN